MSAPQYTFPLMRHLSYFVTPYLVRIGLSPNQVTLLGLINGVLAAMAFSQGDQFWGIVGALLWVLCSLMDDCDGEVARITGRTSRFGKYFDDVTDAIVHTVFFLGLGLGTEKLMGEPIWFWLGVAAAVGSLFNAILAWIREFKRHQNGIILDSGDHVRPQTIGENFIFVFRSLARADFWLLVLVLQLLGVTWLLLPAAAIGAQVYLITGFVKGADRFAP